MTLGRGTSLLWGCIAPEFGDGHSFPAYLAVQAARFRSTTRATGQRPSRLRRVRQWTSALDSGHLARRINSPGELGLAQLQRGPHVTVPRLGVPRVKNSSPFSRPRSPNLRESRRDRRSSTQTSPQAVRLPPIPTKEPCLRRSPSRSFVTSASSPNMALVGRAGEHRSGPAPSSSGTPCRSTPREPTTRSATGAQRQRSSPWGVDGLTASSCSCSHSSSLDSASPQGVCFLVARASCAIRPAAVSRGCRPD